MIDTESGHTVTSRRASAIAGLVLLLGAVRFVYSISTSPQGWAGHTYMEVVYAEQQTGLNEAETGLKRRWGPVFLAAMNLLKRVPVSEHALHIVIRVLLTALYGTTAFWLATVVPPWSSPH